jgi:hypothetical protein
MYLRRMEGLDLAMLYFTTDWAKSDGPDADQTLLRYRQDLDGIDWPKHGGAKSLIDGIDLRGATITQIKASSTLYIAFKPLSIAQGKLEMLYSGFQCRLPESQVGKVVWYDEVRSEGSGLVHAFLFADRSEFEINFDTLEIVET